MPVIRSIQSSSIISKSGLPVGDYSVNPYIGCTNACKYCYASFMKRFTGHKETWGEFLDVKYWPKITNPQKYQNRELFIGSVTDPYNPQEEIYRRTRTLLEQLQGSGAKLTLQTKSDLVLRDLDLLKTFTDVRVGFSINTLDENFRKDMDRAVSIERRLLAMEKLHSAGIRTTCFISPIFPEITDVQAIIKRVLGHCNLVWLENLNLRGNYKPLILGYIKNRYPQLLPLYYEIYSKGSKCYWQELDIRLQKFCKAACLEYITNEDRKSYTFSAKPPIVNFFYHSEIRKNGKRQG